jgi:hypothetical protein
MDNENKSIHEFEFNLICLPIEKSGTFAPSNNLKIKER